MLKVNTTSSPLVSIIIPCYNAERFLNSCFECLDSQTYKNLHVIFVNDGSTDNTLSILQEYCALHPDYTLLTSENQGVGGAKRWGLENIKGEYFTLIDSDDLIAPIHIENLVKMALDFDADVSCCGCVKLSEKKAKKYKFPTKTYKKVEQFVGIDAVNQYLSQEKLDFILVNKLFSTKVLRESGATFIDCRYGEESYFMYHFLKKVNKVVYSPVNTYVYIQWKSSLMHVGFNPTRLDIVKNLQLVMQDAMENLPKAVPYVSSMRAGYLVGLLFFIKNCDYKDKEVINNLLDLLSQDVKQLKHCKRTALYKRIFIPLIPSIAKCMLKKRLK